MILLRHGQTIFNAVFGLTRIDPGIPDPPLTAEGRRQIRAVADALARERLTRLVASPYTRALETAEVLADRLALAVTIEPLISEQGRFACDIGTHRSSLARRWPAHDFGPLPERWWPEESESEADFLSRCRRFRSRAAELADWRETLVVTHWGVIRALTGRSLANGEWVRYEPGRAPDPG